MIIYRPHFTRDIYLTALAIYDGDNVLSSSYMEKISRCPRLILREIAYFPLLRAQSIGFYDG